MNAHDRNAITLHVLQKWLEGGGRILAATYDLTADMPGVRLESVRSGTVVNSPNFHEAADTLLAALPWLGSDTETPITGCENCRAAVAARKQERDAGHVEKAMTSMNNAERAQPNPVRVDPGRFRK